MKHGRGGPLTPAGYISLCVCAVMALVVWAVI